MNVEVNGVAIAYEVFGSGAPLVLLHGNGEDHHIFDVIAKRLMENFTVYAIDSRNHGLSEKTDDYSYDTMAEDVYQFIHVLELGKVDVVGFSDGGIIALLLAMAYAETVNKLILMGINLSPDDFSDESHAFALDMYEKTKDPLFKLMLEEPNINLEALAQVMTPALVIAGEDDIFKPELFPAIVETMTHAELLIMMGHTHDSYIVDKDMLYEDIVSFLQ